MQKIGKVFETNSIVFNSELLKICESLFTIPEQNANVERVFSTIVG